MRQDFKDLQSYPIINIWFACVLSALPAILLTLASIVVDLIGETLKRAYFKWLGFWGI